MTLLTGLQPSMRALFTIMMNEKNQIIMEKNWTKRKLMHGKLVIRPSKLFITLQGHGTEKVTPDMMIIEFVFL